VHENPLSKAIIGAAIEVHRHLGPGLLESAYEACLYRELRLRELDCERQKPLSLDYKGERFEAVYRLDLVVEGKVIVEVKAVEQLLPIHQAQLLTYLRLTDLRLGLLTNFNIPILHRGVKRVAYKLEDE